MMGIIDKCWVRGDATLCVVIFTLKSIYPQFSLISAKTLLRENKYTYSMLHYLNNDCR